jgi:large subunit ribosomal protein L23
VFDVAPEANKVEIRKAVEKIYDVKVRAVRTANFQGKVKRVGRKIGRKSSWKKAYVLLKEGSSIDIIEGL